MRKFIADYVKSCSECIRYKATNQKPAGLLQTPVPAQRFESIAIDFFGPLPETTEATRGLLATDHVILNHGQVTWTTPELASPSPNYHTTPTGGHFSSRQI
ncbi:pro-Pol polyprotein [Trichonephila clavipes]|nr:pro-Pol polyprotein [Trichonephila clavipes]